jgi:hypothetical protein
MAQAPSSSNGRVSDARISERARALRHAGGAAWPIGYADLIPVTSAAPDPSDGGNDC